MGAFKVKGYKEFLNEKWSGDHISIFDIDDTLVVTAAKIKVYDMQDDTEYSLTPAEFNKYERQSHHHVDYSEFDDPNLLLQGKPIKWVLNILKKTMNKEKAVGIITARQDKQLIIDFLKKHDVKINPDFVFAVNDPKTKYKGSNAERKKQAFKDLIDMGFRDFRFFDDNLDNLEYVKQLEHEYDDVTVETKHIIDKWIPLS